MEQFTSQPVYAKPANKAEKGFTLVELMITIAVVGVLTTIAMPSLNNFIVKMRVENEMLEMHRLLLTARNSSINTGLNTTVCPLDGALTCTNNWQNDISVFTNINNINDNQMNPGDILIKVKSAIKVTDQLIFSSNQVPIYTPEGRTFTNIASSFTYCPKGYSDESNGISVSTSGRTYIGEKNTSGYHVDRVGTVFTCP